jgi:hypothetical protein
MSTYTNTNTTTRRLGQSQYNVNVGLAGDRLVNVYRQRRGLPAIIQYAEMESDNAEVYFMRYCKWVATTLIPAYFDDNLQPSNTESIRCCTTSTLAQCVGQHLKKNQTLNQCLTLPTTMSTNINELQLQQNDTAMTIGSQNSNISLLQTEAAGLKKTWQQRKGNRDASVLLRTKDARYQAVP